MGEDVVGTLELDCELDPELPLKDTRDKRKLRKRARMAIIMTSYPEYGLPKFSELAREGVDHLRPNPHFIQWSVSHISIKRAVQDLFCVDPTKRPSGKRQWSLESRYYFCVLLWQAGYAPIDLQEDLGVSSRGLKRLTRESISYFADGNDFLPRLSKEEVLGKLVQVVSGSRTSFSMKQAERLASRNRRSEAASACLES